MAMAALTVAHYKMARVPGLMPSVLANRGLAAIVLGEGKDF